MSLGTTFLKVQKVVVKNAPTILAVMGAVGAVAAVGLAIDGTLKAQEELDRIAREQKGKSYYKAQEAQRLLEEGRTSTDICKVFNEDVESEDDANAYVRDLVELKSLTTKEKILFYAKHYAPAAVMLTASLVCIFSGNHISKKRILQLTGALAASTATLNEYKDKVEEIVGPKKAKEIKDELAQDKVLTNPATAANTCIPDMGNKPDLSLWYDTISDRYFYSNIDYIRKAEIEAQRLLDKNGFCSMNDIYAILGIKEIPVGDDVGWQKDMNGTVVLETGAVLDDKGNPVGTLSMEVRPSSAWLSEV
jgi:hypothetical protein